MIDLSAVSRNLTNEPARNVAEVSPAWDVDSPDPCHHLIVMGHLLFDLKVSRGS
jgi:hypothetical protein